MLKVYQNPDKDYTASRLSRELESVYAHVSKTVTRLEAAGLVERKKVGRSKYLSLTPDGQAVAGSLESSVRAFEMTGGMAEEVAEDEE